PEMVPYEFMSLCGMPSREVIDAARKRQGPHGARWVRTYANREALRALNDLAAAEYPPGAMLAKEKLRDPSDRHPEGVAFMVKHPKAERPEGAGWEFSFFPGGPVGAGAACIACHRDGASKDYVFRRYGPSSAGQSAEASKD